MEEREPCGSIACTFKGKKLKLKLFDAQEWDAKLGADTRRFRLQRSRSWFSPGGQKYEFFSVDGVLNQLRLLLEGVTEPAAETPPKPSIRAGQRVRWMRSTYPARENPGILTWALTPPFQAIDGTWKIFLRGSRAGLVPSDPIPCDEVQPL